MKVSANLTMLFTEVPLLQRYKLARLAGFNYVEVSLPYSETAENLRKAADENGIFHSMINAPPGDWSNGDRGIAAISHRQEEFQKSIETAYHYLQVLQCVNVHIMAGIQHIDDNSARTYKTNIEYAARFFQQRNANIQVLIEPINIKTMPGYFLNCYNQAKSIIDELELDHKLINVGILFDVFHAEQINGKVAETLNSLAHYINYFQVAQVPDRHEPDTKGAVDYSNLFKLIQANQSHKAKYIGCEYVPTNIVDPSFDWVKKFELEF